MVLSVCACGVPPAVAPTQEHAREQIVSGEVAGSREELTARADHALANARWEEAIAPLIALRNAARLDPARRGELPQILGRLASAYDHASRLEDAWSTYVELSEFATSQEARAARDKHLFLAIYLDKDADVARLGALRLTDPHVTERGRLFELAARSIAASHAGEDAPAMRDAQDALDLAERLGVGLAGRLPLDVAMVHYALAEVRRVRSERISFATMTPSEFFTAFQARCAGLLAAQSAYTDAIRSEDPRAAILAGVSLGRVYMRIHRDVLVVPPSKKADTMEKQQLHDAMMRVRYRVLLEKGGDMMERSLALAEKLGDLSPWRERAKEDRETIRLAIDAEHKRLEAYPWTEKEVEDALEILRKQTLAKLAAEEERQRKSWPK